jgi:hypothetical protein
MREKMEGEGKERTCAREEKKGTTTPTPNSMYVYVFVNLLFVIDKRQEDEGGKKSVFFYVVLFDLLLHAKMCILKK